MSDIKLFWSNLKMKWKILGVAVVVIIVMLVTGAI
jgi:hypothetical protein